mgnify:CR=1 FL=1
MDDEDLVTVPPFIQAGLGKEPQHCQSIKALATAAARNPTQREELHKLRQQLVSEAGEHIALDVSGVIAFFSTITQVVDGTGHYSGLLVQFANKMVPTIVVCRKLRAAVTAPYHALQRCLQDRKKKQKKEKVE